MTSELRQGDRIHGELLRSVPCVDAQSLAGGEAQAIATVREACLEPGFFFLEGGFDGSDSTARTLRQMATFFGLDDADPRKQAVDVSHSLDGQGWTPLFGELPYQPGTTAYVESFDCGRPPPTGRDESAAFWPGLPGFRNDVRACWNTLAMTGDAVLTGLSLAAGMERRFLADRCASHELSKLRLLNYPQNAAPESGGNVGISAHTDFECMTLILQTAPGLELLAADGNWYDVPAYDGRLVVLLDDMLEHWTNGFFRATGHRVRNTPGQRFSIVMFFAVNDDEIVAPLAEFVTPDRAAKYPAVRQREHLDRELKKATLNRDMPVPGTA